MKFSSEREGTFKSYSVTPAVSIRITDRMLRAAMQFAFLSNARPALMRLSSPKCPKEELGREAQPTDSRRDLVA